MKHMSRIEKLIRKYYRDVQQLKAEGGTPLEMDAGFDGARVFDKVLEGMDNSTRSSRKGSRRWLIAASLAALIGISAWLYMSRPARQPVVMKTLTTRRGQVASIVLEDGTKVWMNAASTLQYPASFSGNTRDVQLEGEAYFEVAPDVKKAFIIHTDKISTQVVGTSFNISAYGESAQINVAVLTGSVKVMQEDGRQPAEYVTPHQQLVYSKREQRFSISKKFNAGSAAAWKDGKLAFTETPLAEVLQQLQRRYNARISADTAIQQCLISADFSNESLEDVLAVLAEIINGRSVKQQDEYVLKGKGC